MIPPKQRERERDIKLNFLTSNKKHSQLNLINYLTLGYLVTELAERFMFQGHF